MGFFGAYLFDGHRWTAHQPAEQPTIAEPWLLVDIHDSDIATVTYRPVGPGSGVAYLGHTPRTYFENPDASAPTDVAREAAGLGAWWAQQRGGASDTERSAKEAGLTAYLPRISTRQTSIWTTRIVTTWTTARSSSRSRQHGSSRRSTCPCPTTYPADDPSAGTGPPRPHRVSHASTRVSAVVRYPARCESTPLTHTTP